MFASPCFSLPVCLSQFVFPIYLCKIALWSFYLTWCYFFFFFHTSHFYLRFCIYQFTLSILHLYFFTSKIAFSFQNFQFKFLICLFHFVFPYFHFPVFVFQFAFARLQFHVCICQFAFLTWHFPFCIFQLTFLRCGHCCWEDTDVGTNRQINTWTYRLSKTRGLAEWKLIVRGCYITTHNHFWVLVMTLLNLY